MSIVMDSTERKMRKAASEMCVCVCVSVLNCLQRMHYDTISALIRCDAQRVRMHKLLLSHTHIPQLEENRAEKKSKKIRGIHKKKKN